MRQIPLERAPRLLYPSPLLLISSRYERKSNIAPLSYYGIVSTTPFLLSVSLAPSSFTCHLVRQSGDFVLSVPDVTMLNEVHFAGTHSGRDRDKVKQLNLLSRGVRMVGALAPANVLALLECEVRESRMAGGMRVFLAEVESAEADAGAFDEGWDLSAAHWFHHLGGDRYLCQGKALRAVPRGEEDELPAG